MEGSRNSRGRAHENGSIEGPHGHLKRALGDALLLRGSPDFETIGTYRAFLARVVSRRNARARERIDAERAVLGALPGRRSDGFEETLVRVTSTGGFSLRRVFYTVPSRLVGHRLRVRLYDDRLVVFAGTDELMTLPRGHAGPGGRRGRVVDYRHVLPSLRRKPMALLNWVQTPRTPPELTWIPLSISSSADSLSAMRRVLQRVGQDGFLDGRGHSVRVRPLRPRQPIDESVGAVQLKAPPDLVELLAAVAHDPARLRDVAEFLGEL